MQPTESITETTGARADWTKIERTVQVNAPPEAVRAVLQNTDKIEQIYVGVHNLQRTGNYPEVGGSVSYTYRIGVGGIQAEVTLRSVENRPGYQRSEMEITRFRWSESATSGRDTSLKGAISWRYEADGEGTTLTGSYEYEVTKQFFAQAMESRILRPQNVRYLDMTLANIKKLAENR